MEGQLKAFDFDNQRCDECESSGLKLWMMARSPFARTSKGVYVHKTVCLPCWRTLNNLVSFEASPELRSDKLSVRTCEKCAEPYRRHFLASNPNEAVHCLQCWSICNSQKRTSIGKCYGCNAELWIGLEHCGATFCYVCFDHYQTKHKEITRTSHGKDRRSIYDLVRDDYRKPEQLHLEKCQRCGSRFIRDALIDHKGKTLCAQCCRHGDNRVEFGPCPVCHLRTNLFTVDGQTSYCSSKCLDKARNPPTVYDVAKNVAMCAFALIILFIWSIFHLGVFGEIQPWMRGR